MNWIPDSNTKIFRYRGGQRDHSALIRHLEFFCFEAILFSDLDFIEGARQSWFKDLGELKKVVRVTLPELEQSRSRLAAQDCTINIIFDEWTELIDVKSLAGVAWLTKRLGVSDFKFSESTLRFKNIPVFYEVAQSDGDAQRHPIDLALAGHDFFIQGNSLPSIRSLEPKITQTEEQFFWNQEPKFSQIFNSDKIDLSIVIPLYNRGALLPSLLRAVNDSVSVPTELILVDDGSHDDTEKLLLSFCAAESIKFDISYYYMSRNPSKRFTNRVGPVRNFGATRSRGAHLLFLDSDIILNSQTFSRINFEDSNHQILQARRIDLSREQTHLMIKNLEKPEAFFTSSKEELSLWVRERIEEKIETTVWGASYFWLIGKELFQKLGGFKSCYTSYGWEDTDLLLRAQARGVQLTPVFQEVLHLDCRDTFSEYQDDQIDRKVQLAPGAETLFINHFDGPSFRCFYYGLIRALIFYRFLTQYFPLSLKSDYLEQISNSSFRKLVSADVGYAAVELDLENPISRNLQVGFLKRIKASGIKLGRVLFISRSVSLFPTALLFDSVLGVEEVRSIVLQPGANFLDDFVNFKEIIGWRFKSVHLQEYEVVDSRVSLKAVNSKGEYVNLDYTFDTLIFQDQTQSYDPLRIISLNSKTQVYCLGENETQYCHTNL